MFSYVSSGVSEAARYYTQLAGQVMSRLLRCESFIAQSFQQIHSLFHQYAGRLETVVMEQVESIRTQFVQLAASYAEIFRPYTEYFEKYVEAVGVFYVDMVDNIKGITLASF